MIFPLYLEKLKILEREKPKAFRCDVPSARQIANEAGLKQATANRIIYGHIGNLSLEKAAKILDVMRARGFDTKLTDMLEYVPDTEV
ncbi:MAG: hypothetical protein ACPGWR_08700 [Ardenticatenaceae bacterium]